MALCQKFHLKSYTGVDVNRSAIAWAQKKQKLPVPATFIAGDIIKLNFTGQYDVVVSLSCADWNIETDRIIGACWERVKAGGYLVISLRLTPGPGVNDIQTSYQHINFSGQDPTAEVANYVVFNFSHLLHNLKSLQPAPGLIGAYGYWGQPSPTAVTLFKRLVFAVFYLRKRSGDRGHNIEGEFTLPLDIFL